MLRSVLGGFAIAGGVLAVCKLLSDQETQKVESAWNGAKRDVSQRLSQQNQRLSNYQRLAKKCLETQTLKNLHRESYTTADLVYQELAAPKQLLKQNGQHLGLLKQKRQACFDQLKTITDKTQRDSLRQEIKAYSLLRDHLFTKREQLKAELAAIYQQLRELNQRTHALKLELQQLTGLTKPLPVVDYLGIGNSPYSTQVLSWLNEQPDKEQDQWDKVDWY